MPLLCAGTKPFVRSVIGPALCGTSHALARSPARPVASEFFEDFLIRKVYAGPQEYVEWPPAIRLFYLFLKDKGYIDDTASMMSMINALD